jgi:arginase family enzyme
VIDTLLALEADVVGADIVEFNPRQDVGHLTENLAAKLAKEIAARMLDVGSGSRQTVMEQQRTFDPGE